MVRPQTARTFVHIYMYTYIHIHLHIHTQTKKIKHITLLRIHAQGNYNILAGLPTLSHEFNRNAYRLLGYHNVRWEAAGMQVPNEQPSKCLCT